MSKRKASSDASHGAAKRPAVDDEESSSDSDSQMDQSQRPDFQTELVRHMRISRKFCQRGSNSDLVFLNFFVDYGRENPNSTKTGHHRPVSETQFKWWSGPPVPLSGSAHEAKLYQLSQYPALDKSWHVHTVNIQISLESMHPHSLIRVLVFRLKKC